MVCGKFDIEGEKSMKEETSDGYFEVGFGHAHVKSS